MSKAYRSKVSGEIKETCVETCGIFFKEMATDDIGL